MYQTMEVNAYVRVEGDTDIQFLTCREGLTEFTFDRDGLVLTVTESGLAKLAQAVNGALRDREASGESG